MQIDFYPYGVQYHRAPTPLPEDWAGDLESIAAAGYTHVQFRPQWKCHERVRGRFVWDDLDRLFDLARENGLRVVLKPMLETAPDWVFSELNGQRIGFNGRPIPPIAIGSFYVGGWLPCFDNPEVATACVTFVREMVARYQDHPALWFYDAWNEPRSRPLGQCQCPHSIASYRKWLADRYGTVERLNDAFGKAWTAFETVQPPQSGWDYAEMYLWRTWAADAVAGHVRLVSDAIRSVDRDAFVMVHVGGCSVIQDAACDTSDDMRSVALGGVDVYGTSFPVPLHPRTPMENAAPDLVSDWLRRVDPLYWCHEFYANHGEWCEPPEPSTLTRLMWMAVAGGAAGFTFWQYRSERVGNETNGYGMREIDGSPTERSRACDAMAAVLKNHGHVLAHTRRERSRVALLYSRESDLLSRITVMGSMFAADEDSRGDYPYKRAIRAAHALYLQCGETVDWIVPGDSLDGVELLHVTAAEMIDQAAADWLKDYVYRGGKVIVEFPSACRDANTWVSVRRPNNGLDDVLGCVEGNRVVAGGGPADEVRFANGECFPAGGWRIVLDPRGAEVIANWSDGSPAAVRHAYGTGTVNSLGASLSLSFTDQPDDPALRSLEWLLGELSMGANASSPDVWVRRRRGPDSEIWFVFNISASAQSIELPARPLGVWHGPECGIDGCHLSLPAGATWVAEMALS